MSDYSIFKDYGHAIRNKLMEDVNGYVKFDLIPEADCIVFHIEFKAFKFRYVITDVSSSLYNDGSDLVVDSIERKYRRAIMDGFFKSERAKEREKLKGMEVEA